VSVVSSALDPAKFVSGKEVLAGTSLTPVTATATAFAGLDAVSGTVSQDLSATKGGLTPLQGLSGQGLSVTGGGLGAAESVTTDSKGNFVFLVPDNAGAVSVKVTASGANVPVGDVLDNTPSTAASLAGTGASSTGTNPVTLGFTPAASTNYTAIPFDFWMAPDTAPVLSGAPGSALPTTGNAAVVLYASGALADVQLDGTFSADYSGTTLTVQRYVGGVAAPVSTDVFAGSGTSSSGVFLNAGTNNVQVGGTVVGTYTQTGGVLTITFASTGVTKALAASVLQGLTYGFGGASSSLPQSVVIGAQIDDANSDPIGLNGFSPKVGGPHDQGVGGDLLSNVLLATVSVAQPVVTPSLSIVGESNATAGKGTLFDPTGQTLPSSVLTTDGEITRMRASLQLPTGSNTGVSLSVVLPTGLSFANDGSVKVLLVSAGGDVVTTLSGAGLQLAEGGTAVDTTKLGLGVGASDPVTASLASGAIGVSGQTVTFSLGGLAVSGAVPAYAIVEFNATVGNSVADKSSLTTTLTGTANGATTSTVSDFENVQAPSVSVAKSVSGIVNNPDGTVTVTYVDVVTNNGSGPAYNAVVTDPGAGVGTATYGGTTSGTGVVGSASASGGGFNATLTSLPSKGSQSFTYSVVLPAASVPGGISDAASTVSVVSSALDPAKFVSGKEVLAGTSLTPVTATATAFAGLDAVSGTVSQDLSATKGGLTPLQGLSGQGLSVTGGGLGSAESVTTDSKGNFVFLAPSGRGSITLVVSETGPSGPAGDVLDNVPSSAASLAGTAATSGGTNPATLTFTPASNAAYSGIPFDFWVAPDTAPALSGAPASPLEVVGSIPVTLFATAGLADTQLDGTFAGDFSGTTLTLQRYVGGTASPDAGDRFAGTGTASTGVFLNSTSNSVTLNGVAVGTFTNAAGLLTINFASTGVTNAVATSVLRGIAYSYAGAASALTPGVQIGARIDDANSDPIGLNGFTPKASGPHDQGVGGNLLSNLLLASLAVEPASTSATFFEPNDSPASSAAIAVAPALDLSNIANTPTGPTSATVTISGARAEDLLAFTNTAKITGSYVSGVLTLTPVSGQSPSIAEWQAALRAVTYADTSDVPVPSARALTVTLNDGSASAAFKAGVTVVPANDSPILDSSVAVAVAHATEVQSGTPVPAGTVGTLVSQLVGLAGAPGNVADPDGAGLTNGAAATAPGIAIIDARTSTVGGTSVGTWYYSINNGATWTAFPAGLSAQAPLDLSPTARVVFQPTSTDYNGTIPNALTFRAWDGFDGTANGSRANLAGVSVFGQTAPLNSAATAYSAATDTIPLIVDNVNNAPLASGSASLAPVSSDTTNPPGSTVAALFGPGFSDPRDQQFDASGNPTGSVADNFAGIAITSNSATASQGTWRYSTDGGTTWVNVPGNVSTTNALLLPVTARISFLPTSGFSGTPGALGALVIDKSATTIAAGVTGQSLGNGTQAFAGIDVSNRGGSTAVSSNTIQLSTSVLAANVQHVFTPPDSGVPEPLTNNQFGLNGFHTNDYLSKPLIPDLSLVGSVANRFIIVEQHAVISVPQNIFQDTMDDPKLVYEAKLPDGSPLPSWLSFDPSALTFQGTPPANAYGRVEILIRATDIAGRTADATFNILIGRKQDDIVALLAGRKTGRLADLIVDARPPVDALPAAALAVLNAPAPTPLGGGFSAALRATSGADATGRTRALLDRLDALARAKPAA
jgi:hypothetical protein